MGGRQVFERRPVGLRNEPSLGDWALSRGENPKYWIKTNRLVVHIGDTASGQLSLCPRTYDADAWSTRPWADE
jgi:hypothetical protein